MAATGKRHFPHTTPDTAGDAVYQDITGGAAHVTTEKTGVAHNRNIDAALTTYGASTNSATWTSAEGVTELRILAFEDALAKAYDGQMGYLVVINAPTDAIAGVWLADTGGATQDVVYEAGFVGQELIIKRTSAITRIDVLPFSAATRFVIGAV